jgi:cyclophilin family peptidyl-prolyl cis-trans isomerase
MNTFITVLLPALLLMMAAGCDPTKPPPGGTPQDPKSRPTTGPAAKGAKADFPVVKFETTEGNITLELDRRKAPITVDNFLNYVRKGFYEGTVFHRIDPNFMIQGGGFTDVEGTPKSGTDKPIKNESSTGLSNTLGTIAMARTGQVDSATSQFFINLKDNSRLDYSNPGSGGGYCAFGKLKDDESSKTVEKIKAIPVVPNPMMRGEVSKPTKTVKITKGTIVSE